MKEVKILPTKTKREFEFEIGDEVRIKKEWRSENEKDEIYIVTNTNEVAKDCYITPKFTNLPLPGQERVGWDMIFIHQGFETKI